MKQADAGLSLQFSISRRFLNLHAGFTVCLRAELAQFVVSLLLQAIDGHLQLVGISQALIVDASQLPLQVSESVHQFGFLSFELVGQTCAGFVFPSTTFDDLVLKLALLARDVGALLGKRGVFRLTFSVC